MEEDLIEESASRSKKPTNTPREGARNHLQTSTIETHQHAKAKATRKRRSFLGQRVQIEL